MNPGLPTDHFDSFDSDEESTYPIEHEHHVIFDCPSYTFARQLFPDIFRRDIVTVSQFPSRLIILSSSSSIDRL